MTLESYSRVPAASNQASAYSAFCSGDSRTAVIEGQRRREREAKNRAPLLETSPQKASTIGNILRANESVSTEGQNARVLRILRDVGPTTAMELQQLADIRHAPARVLQLKQAGHEIIGEWVVQVSALGHAHRTMLYRLVCLAAVPA